MADQFKEKKDIDINEVFKKIIEQYKTIINLKKDELNIEKIELFTIFYRLYNLSIKYAIIFIKAQELAAGLKSNTEKKIKDILNNYYKYSQHLKENIDIIKIDLEEKIKNSNFKNQKIIYFKNAVEESKVIDTNFKEYCAKYNYFNRSLVSNYSNKLQHAYDEIIKGNSQIINEYLEIFYDNYIKLMEELDKVKNNKIKKGLYVKKLKIDELLTNKNFSKKKQANSIKIPNRIINSITNLNKYNLPTLQSNLISEHKKPKEFNTNSETRKKLAEKLGSLKKEINALIKTKYPNDTKLMELTVNKLKNKINTLSVLTESERQKLKTKLLETKKIENNIKSLTKKISSNYENLLPKYQNQYQYQNQNQNMNMNRLKELQLSSKIRSLTNKEKKEFQELSKKQNNNLKIFLKNYQPENNGIGVVNNLPEINSAAGVFFTRNLNPAASKSA